MTKVRSSSVARICTNRPTFDEAEYKKDLIELKEKALKKKIVFEDVTIKNLQETAGLATIANKVAKHQEKEMLFKLDPLPDGAKTYLKELWLKANYGFVSFSLLENTPSLLKGNFQEDNAIVILNRKLGENFQKNTVRKDKGFLTGECDVINHIMIRDTKVPETWVTFKAKHKIEDTYYWQGIAYCYLYERLTFWLDYVLMPVPDDVSIQERFTRGFSPNEKEEFFKMQEKIDSMPPEERVKSFSIPTEDIKNDIKFLISRLEKSEKYYNSLTYNKCMNIYV